MHQISHASIDEAHLHPEPDAAQYGAMAPTHYLLQGSSASALALIGVGICLIALLIAAASSVVAVGVSGLVLLVASSVALHLTSAIAPRRSTERDSPFSSLARLGTSKPATGRVLPQRIRPNGLRRPNSHSAAPPVLLFAPNLPDPLSIDRLSPATGHTRVAHARRAAKATEKRESSAIFGLSAALYLIIAVLLAYRYDSFNLDAFSREANAFYMIFSRDPHLAAIGFVWNPLTSLLDIPLIILRPLWPALATRAFAAYIMSALFMAGSVKVMAECLADLAVARFNRWLITAMYAVHPMIAYYGGNGMSEGIFLFTLMMTCRYLIRWLKEPDLKSLILSGTALALAYLARNEAVFPAALGVLTVGVFTYSRDRGRRVGRRVASAATDVTIFSAPFAVCFFGWAVVSWVVVGHPFEQFSSVYGTASQLQAARKAGTLAAHGGIQTVARQLIALEPMLPAIVVLSCLVVVKRRNVGPLAPALVFGGVLCFAVLASLGGKTVGFFRYDIAEVPFSCLLAGVLVSAPLEGSRKCGRWAHVVAPILSIVLLAPAFPFTYRAMMDRTIGTEENENLAWIFGFGATGSTRRWRDVATVAREIDKLELSNGSILVDNFSPCFPELILNSNRPQQFVIPNDRDYERVLADPTTFHAAYFLVPPTVGSTGFGGLNAVNRAYPHLYDSGAGIADLVRDFNPSGCENWRLYRVKTVVPAANGSPSPAPRGS